MQYYTNENVNTKKKDVHVHFCYCERLRSIFMQNTIFGRLQEFNWFAQPNLKLIMT